MRKGVFMALSQQAKILSPAQQKAVLLHLSQTRNPIRNTAIFLLSVKAGLRAKEIANITWSMVTDAEGQISDRINLQDKAAKGRSGGRIIWMNRELMAALISLYEADRPSGAGDRIIRTERSDRTTPQVMVNTLKQWYVELGFDGCSSHSGRRTFITNTARKISSVGGSLRDVQMLAGHSALSTTQRYIEADREAMKKVVDLI